MASDVVSLRVCSFNMHGFNNSAAYLNELCSNNDVIFIQEHRLMSTLLFKFDKIHDDFAFIGCSAMDNKCEQGLLSGRPFGGVGILYRKNCSVKISVAGYHSEGRVIAVTLSFANQHLLCFGVYMPCDDGKLHYCDKMSDIVGFIESIAELYPGYKCLVLGDFNFECDSFNRGYREFIPVIHKMHLTVCDSMDSNCVGYTYSHNTLDHKSLIDHVFVHKELVPLITEYKVLLDATNCSDHLAVQVCLSFNCNDCHTSGCSTRKSAYVYRWDKGDLQSYYVNSGNLLSKICQQFTCMNNGKYCDSSTCHLNIDIYYSEIVHCLNQSSKISIPCIPKML